MKRSVAIVTLVILALAVPASMLAQQNSKAEQQLRELRNTLNQALLKGDIAMLEKDLADETITIRENGSLASKAELLESFRSGKVKYDSLEESDTNIRIYGKTAVMTSIRKVTGQAFGKAMSGQTRNTYVYVYRNGKWLPVLHQMTAIMPPTT